MKLIKPNQISGEILTLFDEADKEVLIVSPYCKISKWYKLLSKLKSLQERSINIEFYIRDGEDNIESYEEVKNTGIIPIKIKNLHCKIYMNEKSAIFSSMNLLLSSEINSLELAYKTENEKEYKELLDFCDRYIRINTISESRKDEKYNQIEKNEIENIEFNRNLMFNKLSSFSNLYIAENRNDLLIKTRNNTYQGFIYSKTREKKLLRISGILSQKEFEYARTIIPNIESRTNLKIECIDGGKGYYDTIWATSNKYLQTTIINEPLEREAEYLGESLASFISEVEKIKNYR